MGTYSPATKLRSISIKKSGNQNINHSLYDTVILNSIDIDDFGTFNTTTGIFTVPEKGRYRVTASLGFTRCVADKFCRASIGSSKGSVDVGADVAGNYSSAPTANFTQFKLGGIKDFDAGDQIYLEAYHFFGSTAEIEANLTRMDIVKIG